jgi:hypothetical protein
MKLYTEEQLKEFFKEHYFFMERDLDNLTSIELPSDEEINTENEKIYGKDDIVDMGTNLKWAYLEAFEVGAKWVINQIKQQKDIDVPLLKPQNNA